MFCKVYIPTRRYPVTSNFFMKRTWRIAPIVVGLVLAASIGLVLWEARSAFQESAAEVASSRQLPYQIINLEPSPVPGEELFTSQAALTDAVAFGGNLYVSSSSGISVYSAAGSRVIGWRKLGHQCLITGPRSLPQAVLLALAAGDA